MMAITVARHEPVACRALSRFRYSEIMSSPTIKNISLYQKAKSVVHSCPSRPGQKGVGRRHGRWAGSDGRWFALDDGVDGRTAKPCGPGARGRRQAAGQSKAGRQRRSQPRTRLRGEHDISRKAIAQGMSDVLRCPVCSCAVCFVRIARGTAGAARIRHSLRPLFGEGGKFLAKLGRNASREQFSSSRP